MEFKSDDPFTDHCRKGKCTETKKKSVITRHMRRSRRQTKFQKIKLSKVAIA